MNATSSAAPPTTVFTLPWLCGAQRQLLPPHPADDDGEPGDDDSATVFESVSGGVILVWNYGRRGGGWTTPGCNVGSVRFGADKTRLLAYLAAQPLSVQVAWRKAQDAYFLEHVMNDAADERLRDARQMVMRAARITRELQQDLDAVYFVAPKQAAAIAEELRRRAMIS